MRKLKLFIGLILLSLAGFSQTLITPDDHLVNGFDRKVSGDDFSYHSSISGVEKSLIIRATNGKYSMEWQTEKVPSGLKEKYVTFAWLAGIGSSPGFADMTLTVNNQQKITFHTDSKKDWKIQSADGAELFFHSDMEDQARRPVRFYVSPDSVRKSRERETDYPENDRRKRSENLVVHDFPDARSLGTDCSSISGNY